MIIKINKSNRFVVQKKKHFNIIYYISTTRVSRQMFGWIKGKSTNAIGHAKGMKGTKTILIDSCVR